MTETAAKTQQFQSWAQIQVANWNDKIETWEKEVRVVLDLAAILGPDFFVFAANYEFVSGYPLISQPVPAALEIRLRERVRSRPVERIEVEYALPPAYRM